MNQVADRLAATAAPTAARTLLGWQLIRTIAGTQLAGRIVETEAYHQDDAASHSYKGSTPRTKVMFGPAGHAYVYFTYGMHYCMNVVVGRAGHGAAVLIRAIEPCKNEETMFKNRFGKPLSRSLLDSKRREVANGPAKLCQALAIDKSFNGHDLSQPPLRLRPGEPVAGNRIVTATRIGIKDNTRAKLRFYIQDNPYVSRR